MAARTKGRVLPAAALSVRGGYVARAFSRFADASMRIWLSIGKTKPLFATHFHTEMRVLHHEFLFIGNVRDIDSRAFLPTMWR